jgi:hypothetical protein
MNENETRTMVQKLKANFIMRLLMYSKYECSNMGDKGRTLILLPVALHFSNVAQL